MPVILGDEASKDFWLNGSSNTKFNSMLKPYDKADLIPLKSKEQSNPITKFFSKKGAYDDKESYKIIKEPTKNDVQGDVKKKAESQANLQPTCCGRTVAEIKSDVTTLSPKSDSKVEVKRDYEKFLADSKPSTDELGKLSQTPLKKSKVKGGAEKQATLRSYFTKS